MAVIVYTPNPQQLLAAVYAAIRDNHVRTWSVDGDGDFTHTPASGQFDGRGWFRPAIVPGGLSFSILPQKTRNITVTLYGIYHGRFAEMLLNHFDRSFTNLTITALAEPELGDIVVSR